MSITEQQKRTMWQSLIKYLQLTRERDQIYVGDCPFCKARNSFAVNIRNNFVGCIFCSKKRTFLCSGNAGKVIGGYDVLPGIDRTDELRIGATWADVVPQVPEPASPLALASGQVALAGIRRKGL